MQKNPEYDVYLDQRIELEGDDESDSGSDDVETGEVAEEAEEVDEGDDDEEDEEEDDNGDTDEDGMEDDEDEGDDEAILHRLRLAKLPVVASRKRAAQFSEEEEEEEMVEGESASPPQQRRSVRRVEAASLATLSPRDREAVRARSPPSSSEEEEEEEEEAQAQAQAQAVGFAQSRCSWLGSDELTMLIVRNWVSHAKTFPKPGVGSVQAQGCLNSSRTTDALGKTASE